VIDNTKELTRDEITRLLGKLDAELVAHGQRAIIHRSHQAAVGGPAGQLVPV